MLFIIYIFNIIRAVIHLRQYHACNLHHIGRPHHAAIHLIGFIPGAVAADDEAFHDQEIKVIKNNSPVNLFRV